MTTTLASAPARGPAPAPVVVVGGANLDLLATCDTPARLGDSNPGRLHSRRAQMASVSSLGSLPICLF
jgi:hypothetical protein